MSPLLGDLGGEKEGITDGGDIVGLVGEIGEVGDVVGGNTIGEGNWETVGALVNGRSG